FDGSQRNEDCEMLSDRQKSCAPEIWLAAAASEASSRISSPHKARFLLFFASQMARERGKNSCSNNSASVGFEAKLWSAANKRRALIQMATGSGKTYTAVNFVYRLIKLAGARRVLFLIERGNQTLKDWSSSDKTLSEGKARRVSAGSANQFQQFVTPDDGRKFTELYNVQHLVA